VAAYLSHLTDMGRKAPTIVRKCAAIADRTGWQAFAGRRPIKKGRGR
jgi:hypothetical protein